jgi:hypothetical protein
MSRGLDLVSKRFEQGPSELLATAAAYRLEWLVQQEAEDR